MTSSSPRTEILHCVQNDRVKGPSHDQCCLDFFPPDTRHPGSVSRQSEGPFMGRLRAYFRPQGVNLSSAARLACFPRAKPGCPVFAAKGGIKNGAPKGAIPPQRSDTSYLPRARALNLPVRRSRSQAEPWQPRAVRPGGCLNPRGEAASTFGNVSAK